MDKSEFVSVVDDWRSRIEPFQQKMGAKASKLEKEHYGIGGPAVVMNTVASTTMFTQAGDDTSTTMKIIIGCVSLFAAILTATMTFYSHAKRAEKHRSTAAQLTGLRRTLDIHLRFPPSSSDEMRTKLIELNEAISKVTDEAPTIHFLKKMPLKELRKR